MLRTHEEVVRLWVDRYEHPELDEWQQLQEVMRRQSLSTSELALELKQRLEHVRRAESCGVRCVSSRSHARVLLIAFIEELNLSDTAVSDLGPLAALTNLSRLDLSDTAVSDLGPLAALTNLSRLDLGNTAVNDLGPLAALTNLAHLDLRATAVNDLGPLALTTLSQLLAGTRTRGNPVKFTGKNRAQRR